MAGTDNHWNSGSRKVNMKIWGGVPSFSRNLSMQTPTFMSIGTMVIELREFNDKKKKKKKKNTMDKMLKLNFVRIWSKSGNLMKYLVHRLLLTCSVLSNH